MPLPTSSTKSDRSVGGSSANVLDSLIGYNLKRAYMLVQADFRTALGDDGLTPRVFSALALVVETPDITQSELSRILSIERSGLVAIIDQLEEAELVSRVAVPGDRRVQALSPTKAGKALLASVLESIRAHEQRLFSSLSESEKQQLLSILGKFRNANENPTDRKS